VPGIAGTYDHAEMLPQRREALQWWKIRSPRRRRSTQSAATNVSTSATDV
jgi:hypothetical protein